VRLVLDHEGEHPSRWAAEVSTATKIGCTPQTLNGWVKKAEVDSGLKPELTTDMAAKMKALERENRELSASERDPAQGLGLFCPGRARSPVQAMIAFIDDHREAHGIEPIRKCPDRPIDLPRSCRQAGRPGQAVGAGEARCGPSARDCSRVRRELRGF
jgi:hypothetical protein